MSLFRFLSPVRRSLSQQPGPGSLALRPEMQLWPREAAHGRGAGSPHRGRVRLLVRRLCFGCGCCTSPKKESAATARSQTWETRGLLLCVRAVLSPGLAVPPPNGLKRAGGGQTASVRARCSRARRSRGICRALCPAQQRTPPGWQIAPQPTRCQDPSSKS